MSKKEKSVGAGNDRPQKKKRNLLADQSEFEGFKNAIPEDEIWTYKIDGLQ